MSAQFPLDFPCAFGSPTHVGDFRLLPEDFQVDEVLGFEPQEEGEHVYLHIRKRGENTAWVAEQIAHLAQVSINDVGYGGRKDRHAVTTQWFSVYLPKGQEPDWQLLNSDSVQLLARHRHSRKLRRGDHEENKFVIRLRNVQAAAVSDTEQRLQLISAQGVPNYFGEQRFGHQGNNLVLAQQLFAGKAIRDKQKRGLVLSAARSYLFNLVVAARVQESNWSMLLSGDPEAAPSGPLWGRGRLTSSSATLAVEQEALKDWTECCNALEHVGLHQERRPLVLRPQALSWHWEDGVTAQHLVISFALGSGEFATALLREILVLQSAPTNLVGAAEGKPEAQ